VPAQLQVPGWDELQGVWQEVLARDLEDGQMAVSIGRFREDAEEYLDRLAGDLHAGAYEPGRLTEVVVDRR